MAIDHDLLFKTLLRTFFRKQNWRDFIGQDNPVAAALLSSMGYNKRERVKVKLEFLHMMTRLRLDPARMELLAVFFETYLPLKPEEEAQLQQEIENSPLRKEVQAMEWMTSWEKKGREVGLAEGIEKGIEQGIERGIVQGIEKGKEVGAVKTKVEIAAKMLEENFDPVLIMKITGLTPDELAKLKELHH